MTTVPKTFLGRLQFFEQRLPDWTLDPAAIGLRPEEVAELGLRVAAARARYEELGQIRVAAESATLAHRFANDAMYDYGIDLVKTIRAFAERTGDAGVYTDASIPPPKDPSPSGPPPAPTDVRVELLSQGAVRLRWKGSTARGAYFCISREVPGFDGYRLLDSVARKSFDDAAIPPGATRVNYFIQARRGAFRAANQPVTVLFGSQDGRPTARLAG